MKKRLTCLYLDLLSIPGLFMTKKANAKFHINYLCPKCPEYRKKMRHVKEKKCFWETNWEKENFSIPRTFGIKNWITQYLFLKTDLRKFK